MTTQTQPSEKSLQRMRNYVEKYWHKSGTSAHPNREVTDAVVLGLAHNIDALGRPPLSVQLLARQASRSGFQSSVVLCLRRDEAVQVLPLPALRDTGR